MDKIRKWMTVMALFGTVLVTALFCYMPVREIIREKNRAVMSFQEEQTLGSMEEGAESLKEKLGQETLEETADPEGGTKELPAAKETEEQLRIRTAVEALSFGVQNGTKELTVKIWQSKEGIFYVFLPGFSRESRIWVKETEKNTSVGIGSRVLKSGDEIKDITWEEAYEFTLYGSGDAPLVKAPLVFLKSSDLPVLSLETKSGSMEWISQEKGNEEAGAVSVYDETGGLLYEGEAAGIRGRGNSTWGLSKKPLQLELKEKADLFGFGKARDFVLLADAYDETKLRNQIVLGLAEALDMEYVPEGRPVELYCNGIYYGIYFFTEKVQVDEQRVAIKDMEEASGAVYRSGELQNLERITAEDGSRKWTSSQVEEGDLSGGYLIERELADRYEEEASGFITSQGDRYALQSPRYATENQVNYIADLMQEFQDAAWQPDGINRETGKHYSEYIDVDSFVKKYLVEEITKNYDGGVTSSYFYKPSDSVSKKIFAGPVWDYDVAFGNCNLDKVVSDPMGITRLDDHVWGTELFARLYEKEDFYEQAVSCYEQKALPYLNWLLEEGIDRLAREREQAVKLDSLRWEEPDNRYRYYEAYENGVRYLKYFIEKRRDFLNQVWLEGELYHCVTFRVNGDLYKRIYVKDGEPSGDAPIPYGDRKLFIEWRSQEFDVPYDEYKPVYEDMVFDALWQELEAVPEEP